MENENFCGGNCTSCEKFIKDAPTLAEREVGVPTSLKENVGKEQEQAKKERSKEDEGEEQLHKLARELGKKNKEEKEEYKRKKPKK